VEYNDDFAYTIEVRTTMTISAVLFDLDNTLYPASSGLMHSVDTRITEYIQNLLGLDLDTALALRRRYFVDYGTTLRGLQHHHAVDPEDYLTYVHDLALESFLASDAELDRLLGEIAVAKVIFTNAPGDYARRVLATLGIERHFDQIFDIRFHVFQPKPELAAYRRVLDTLGMDAAEMIFIEDTPQNLPPARALGMSTILVGAEQSLAPRLADYVVPDILAALRVVLDLQGIRR
jgi:putative hydrolase of the HAD superfamily